MTDPQGAPPPVLTKALFFAAAIEALPISCFMIWGKDALGIHGGDAPEWLFLTVLVTHMPGVAVLFPILTALRAPWQFAILVFPINGALCLALFLLGSRLLRRVRRRTTAAGK